MNKKQIAVVQHARDSRVAYGCARSHYFLVIDGTLQESYLHGDEVDECLSAYEPYEIVEDERESSTTAQEAETDGN